MFAAGGCPLSLLRIPIEDIPSAQFCLGTCACVILPRLGSGPVGGLERLSDLPEATQRRESWAQTQICSTFYHPTQPQKQGSQEPQTKTKDGWERR